MSRSKPYDRARGDRNVDGQWKHDLHDTRGSLSSRLGTSSSGGGKGGAHSGAGSSSGSSSLLDRISGGQGKELLPDSAPRKRMYGYDGGAGGSGAATSRNAGIELLPAAAGSSSQGRTARSGRASRPRGSGGDDAGQRALVANGLAALSKRHTSGSSRESLSIVGAARTSIWVRVERLARGTTAEDVKSAFAHAPIGEARLITSGRTVTVDVELPDRDSADRLVQQYDGVAADGERLRVFVRSRDSAGAGAGANAPGNRSGQRNFNAATGALSSRMDRKPNPPPSSGKMYSDNIDGPPAVTAPPREPRQSSLASRLGRR